MAAVTSRENSTRSGKGLVTRFQRGLNVSIHSRSVASLRSRRFGKSVERSFECYGRAKTSTQSK